VTRQPPERLNGRSNRSHTGLRIPHETIAERFAVGVNGRRPEFRQSRQQAAGVVVVAVTQHHVIHAGQVDAELVGVVGDGHTLAGVEQDAPTAPLKPEGQTMLGQQAAAVDRVLHEDGDGKSAGHDERSLQQVVDAPLLRDATPSADRRGIRPFRGRVPAGLPAAPIPECARGRRADVFALDDLRLKIIQG